MATNNSISNISNPIATTALTIDPGASGDSYIQLDINTTGKYRIGIDDDDADRYKISSGSALGGTDYMSMSAAGECNFGSQPAFLANLASADNNQTGAGTTFTLGSVTALTEVYDQNSDFNTNGTFTAPVTGRYYLFSNIDVFDITGAMTAGNVQIVTSNRTYEGNHLNPSVANNNGNVLILTVCTVADMDAADTATFTITLSNGAGDTADVNGNASPITFVCGALIC